MKSKPDSFKVNGSPLAVFVGITIFLFVCWVLLSGQINAKFLTMGCIFSILCAYVCTPFLFIKNMKTGKEYFLLRINPFKFLVYAGWLMIQVLLASLDVTKATFNKSLAKPKIIYFRMDFENPAASALLANSIILTPGTITLDVSDDGVYEIHALTDVAAEGVFDGGMQARVAALYGETCEFIPMRERTITDIPKEID